MEELKVVEEVKEKNIFGVRFSVDDCLIVLSDAIICSYLDKESNKVISLYVDLARYDESERNLSLNKLRRYCKVEAVL